MRKSRDQKIALFTSPMAAVNETCKLNGVDPPAYLTDHSNSRIDELLPWAYPAQHSLKDVA